jgi:hypothetical protein
MGAQQNLAQRSAVDFQKDAGVAGRIGYLAFARRKKNIP